MPCTENLMIRVRKGLFPLGRAMIKIKAFVDFRPNIWNNAKWSVVPFDVYGGTNDK